MVKALVFVAFIFCFTLYLVSDSDKLTKEVMLFKRNTNTILRSDTYRYGDLFGMSCLPEFKIERNRESSIRRFKCNQAKSIDLYALCDSYLWSYVGADSLYCGVSKFEFATINERNSLVVTLDTSKLNILLLEMTERNVRATLYDDYISSFLVLGDSGQGSIKKSNQSEDIFLFNSEINRNIEAILWETNIFTPLKSWKAELNFRLFNRIDEQVAISSNNRFLFYRPTIDTMSFTSSFRSISEVEIDKMIDKLNSAYSLYKTLGFDEIYLSIVPNPVTILEPDYNNQKYNHLITRIQYSEKLRMPVVDIYLDFRSSTFELYYRSDTHWNMTGAYVWLNKFNHLLEQQIISHKKQL